MKKSKYQEIDAKSVRVKSTPISLINWLSKKNFDILGVGSNWIWGCTGKQSLASTDLSAFWYWPFQYIHKSGGGFGDYFLFIVTSGVHIEV